MIGVTGSIAAYKICELVRELKNYGADVRVVMTEAAAHFVTAVTFETLSGYPVLTGIFAGDSSGGTVHIEAARWPDAIIIAPATANIVAKTAAGIADELLSTILQATTAPVIFCPAMNKEMYAKSAFQRNRDTLRALNYRFVDSEQGSLACGEEGWGRLAELDRIIDALKITLLSSQELAGLRVLVTASRTEEDIDPIRFVTNRATGKMGFALAEAGALMGAEVRLITGPSTERPFSTVTCRRLRSAAEMDEAVENALPTSDVLIMAAAVADFRPTRVSPQKIKKCPEGIGLQLERTVDIIAKAGRDKGDKLLVGFAMETENGVQNARAKLHAKNLDFILLNNPVEAESGFGSDTNKITFIDRRENIEEWPVMSKIEAARKIWLKVAEISHKVRTVNE